MSVLQYSCLKCGGELKFEPDVQKWVCISCRSKFTKEELVLDEKKYARTNADEHSILNVYRCDACGGELVAKENEIVSRCLYCRNNVIIKDKLVGKYQPDYIIPFKNTQKEMRKIYNRRIKRKLFIPNDFRKIDNYHITGLYVPYWLFDMDITGDVIFSGIRSHSRRSGDYIVTTTSVYDLLRNGEVTFKRIPSDASLRMDNTIMENLEPYDYDDLIPFSAGYLTGFCAEKYDVSSHESENIAEYRAKNSLFKEFAKSCRTYSNVNVKEEHLKVNNLVVKYVLLPVWIFEINYDNNVYTFTMNGQTDKFVGTYPISKKRLMVAVIIIFVSIILGAAIISVI